MNAGDKIRTKIVDKIFAGFFLLTILLVFLVLTNSTNKKSKKQDMKLSSIPVQLKDGQLDIKSGLESKIVKNGVILDTGVNETTPFVWRGKLKYLTNEGRFGNEGFYLAIYDYETNSKVAIFGKGLTMASAIVRDDKLYIFGTKNPGQQLDKDKKTNAKVRSEIYLITSDDLKSFSDPILLVRALNIQGFNNTSVTRNTTTGKFTMALELYEEGLTVFSIRFLESNDLIHWIFKPYIFTNQFYVASPSIRYVNGYYYLWFLKESLANADDPAFEVKREDWKNRKDKINRIWVTSLARSKDLASWEVSRKTFLTPDQIDEGLNTSDLDLVEWNRKTYIFYMVGDQATWGKIKVATSDTSLNNLVGEYFE